MISTLQDSFRARSASTAACNSIRLLVVCGSDPYISRFVCSGRTTHALPPAARSGIADTRPVGDDLNVLHLAIRRELPGALARKKCRHVPEFERPQWPYKSLPAASIRCGRRG